MSRSAGDTWDIVTSVGFTALAVCAARAFDAALDPPPAEHPDAARPASPEWADRSWDSVWAWWSARAPRGPSKGLGFLLIDSQNTGRTDVMLVAIIVLAGLGKLSDAILGAVENRVVRRRR
jgi:O-methyltransferase involved in polyketide biosynthesis